MLFDNLCMIAERHVPEIMEMLRQTKIFRIEADSKQIIKTFPKEMDENEIRDRYDNFFLPYRNVAVEDNESCIVLSDLIPDQVGMNHFRGYIEVIKVTDQGMEMIRASNKATMFLQDIPYNQDVFLMILGAIKPLEFGNEGMVVRSIISMYALATKKKIINRVKYIPKNDPEINKNFTDSAIAVLYEIMYLNTPDRFILRETPAEERQKLQKKKFKLKRSHQRPVYTILKPDEIRRRMKVESLGDGGSRQPHDRRRHWRYLSDEKYRYDESGKAIDPFFIPSGPRRGDLCYKKVIVPACWIGPQERRVGNKIYKVILDR